MGTVFALVGWLVNGWVPGGYDISSYAGSWCNQQFVGFDEWGQGGRLFRSHADLGWSQLTDGWVEEGKREGPSCSRASQWPSALGFLRGQNTLLASHWNELVEQTKFMTSREATSSQFGGCCDGGLTDWRYQPGSWMAIVLHTYITPGNAYILKILHEHRTVTKDLIHYDIQMSGSSVFHLALS